MKLGTFNKTAEGLFEGTVKTMMFEASLRIEKNVADTGPEFFVHDAGSNLEVGIGKGKLSKDKKPYIRVKIDDPTFPAPIWAALTKADDGYALYWDRPRRKAAAKSDAPKPTL